MKQRLLLALLSTAALTLHAQNWFQNHPQWANYFSFGFQGPGYEYTTVEGDTLLQGLPAVKLRRWHDMIFANDFVDYRHARQHGDTVWVWNHANSAFYIQYNFSLAVGDSVVGPLAWGGGKFRYYIDSVGTLSVHGQSLRFQQVHFYTGYSYFQCKTLVVETIGMINGECINANTNYHSQNPRHLMVDEPNGGATDGADWSFCQFQNDLLSYSNDPPCSGLSAQQEPLFASPAFQVLPNPFHDAFSIVASKDQVVGNLRIFNVAGRLMLQRSSLFDPVSTMNWPAGLYLFEITAQTGQRQFCKALKE